MRAMRQGDGTDLLGPSDPRSASIGVIYVAPNDDRQSVLTAILTQDKLGSKQVVVVMPDQNKAFQRPVDFDGLKNMRRGLKAEIVFIVPSGPGPAEYARQRRFPVYSSLEAFSQSIRLGTLASGTAKRGPFGFGRKKESAAPVAVATVSSSYTGEEKTSALPVNGIRSVPQNGHSPNPDQDVDGASDSDVSHSERSQVVGGAGLVTGGGLAALADDQKTSSTPGHADDVLHAQSAIEADPQLQEITSSNRTGSGNRESSLAESHESQKQADPGPGIITFSTTTPRPKITRKFPVPPAEVVAVPVVAKELASKQNGSTAATTKKKGDTGKMAAAGAGVVSSEATKAGGAVGGSG